MTTASVDAAKSASHPRVAVVVLTWNDTEMTRRCLTHVLASDYPALDVILVDNGSREPCGRRLIGEFPGVRLIELPENRGFTGGGNVGMRAALDGGARYVLHLNNDAFVASDAIGRLVAALEADPRAAIAHALLRDPDSDRVQFYTATVDPVLARHDHLHVGAQLSEQEWPTVETEFVPACVILYRAEALSEEGLYDETLGTNWEDYDLCLRFRSAGWRILAVGGAVAEHMSGRTMGRVSPYYVYHMTRNRLICIGRYAERRAVLRRLPDLVRSFYWDFRRYGFTNWPAYRSAAHGVWDFLLGNTGERSSLPVARPAKRRVV
jgi:GT2 family glycosyltransferase